LDTGCYTWFERDGCGWIKIMSLERGKRIALPLASNYPISGTIRLIVRPGVTEVEVHHTIEAVTGKPCGSATIGVDKGYTEVFVDSDGERHGVGLGKLLSTQTDANNLKYRRRNKIRAVVEKSTLAKRGRIYRNNLGRRKLDCQKARHRQNVRTVVYTAANTVVDKARLVAAEDLTAVIKERGGKRIKGPQEKRRLSAWVKGLIAEALKNVSYRRGSTVRLVNCAYTSQVHSQCGCLAVRKGDTLYCEVCGVVVPSDQEAARVVLARLNDHEIGRWASHQKVKAILQERTSRYRLGLLNQDSSCAVVVSTESELPASNYEQL
jgi:transposase